MRLIPHAVVFVGALLKAECCNPFNSLKYITEMTGMLQCMNIQLTAISRGDIFSLARETLSLDNCIRKSDQNACVAVIEAYVASNSSNKILTNIGSALIANPGTACPCISQYVPNIEQCVVALDEYSSYCDNFGASATTNANCDQTLISVCGTSNSTAGPHEEFKQKMKCLMENLESLKDSCFQLINSLFSSTFSACAFDIATICNDFGAGPLSVVGCLFENSASLSRGCRSSIESLAGNVVPCGEEASQYCAQESKPEDVIACLEQAQQDGKSLSDGCAITLEGFHNCEDSGFFDLYYGYDYQYFEPKPKPGQDDGIGGGRQWKNDDGDGGGGYKPKPGPGGANDDYDSSKPKPGPGGGDGWGGGNDDYGNPKQKPGPGGGGGRGGGNDDYGSPKQKPGPGGGGGGPGNGGNPGGGGGRPGGGQGGGGNGGAGGGGRHGPPSQRQALGEASSLAQLKETWLSRTSSSNGGSRRRAQQDPKPKPLPCWMGGDQGGGPPDGSGDRSGAGGRGRGKGGKGGGRGGKGRAGSDDFYSESSPGSIGQVDGQPLHQGPGPVQIVLLILAVGGGLLFLFLWHKNGRTTHGLNPTRVSTILREVLSGTPPQQAALSISGGYTQAAGGSDDENESQNDEGAKNPPVSSRKGSGGKTVAFAMDSQTKEDSPPHEIEMQGPMVVSGGGANGYSSLPSGCDDSESQSV